MLGLRLGERIADVAHEATPRLAPSELVAAETRGFAVDEAPAMSAFSLALFAALGLGALLLTFSAVPDAILVRGPHGIAVVRARVEIGLIGAAIVVLVGAIFFVASP